MEPRFGRDFSRVPVHSKGRADRVMAGPGAFGSRLADPALGATEDEPFTQILGLGGRDPIHGPLLEEYRRATGQPPGGVDESGRRVGPTDAELKYGGGLASFFESRRTAKFVTGAVHRVWNLAQRLAAGIATLGFTPPLLNGTQILSAAAAVGAIGRPTLGNRTTATGAECWVESVARNEASFDMTLPAAGPWSTVTPKASVASILGSAACSGAGNTTFTVDGDPSTAVLEANLEKHEQKHADDHKTVFETVAIPWDAALNAAQRSRRIFNGADATACQASLFAAMGGTPSAIATNLWNGWKGANDTFHGTPAGATGSITASSANADCSVSSLRIQHP